MYYGIVVYCLAYILEIYTLVWVAVFKVKCFVEFESCITFICVDSVFERVLCLGNASKTL